MGKRFPGLLQRLSSPPAWITLPQPGAAVSMAESRMSQVETP